MTGHGTPDPAWRHGAGDTGDLRPADRSGPVGRHGAGTTDELRSADRSGPVDHGARSSDVDTPWGDLVDAVDLGDGDLHDGALDGGGAREPSVGRDGWGGAVPGLQAGAGRDGRASARSAVDLRTRAVDLRELMDEPDADPRVLDRTFRRFALVNALVSGWRAVWRTHVVPALPVGGTARVLDLGCGGGDLARSIARWAHGDGFAVEVVGVDPDPRAIAAAERSVPAGVTFRTASSADLVAAGERFDVVVSNHVLHHLTDDERAGFLADSAALATGRVVHGDIRRSATAYRAYAAGALLFAAGTFVRVDGLRSVRRSFTVAELAAALPGGWRSESASPHRVLAVWDA